VASVAGEGTDSDSPTDVLMRRIVDAFAEYERLIIGARTKVALKAIRASGKKTGGEVPYGYTVEADGRTLVICEAEQRVIATVRELRSAGMTLRAVSDALASQGMLNRAARAFGPASVASMERSAA
jgi:DNA invertase Pin-like site-specific DNA recombinase